MNACNHAPSGHVTVVPRNMCAYILDAALLHNSNHLVDFGLCM